MMCLLPGIIKSDIGERGIRNRAQGLIEYALIILLVIVVVILTLSALGIQINTLFENIVNSFPES